MVVLGGQQICFFSLFSSLQNTHQHCLCPHVLEEVVLSSVGCWALLEASFCLGWNSAEEAQTHVTPQVQIFKGFLWMLDVEIPSQVCFFVGFHDTCANACCDAGWLCSNRSFL